MTKAVIGSRGSKLALWQSNWVADRLREAHPGLEVTITVIKTTGDRFMQASIPDLGGKGAFTKEIQEALLEHRVDIAVHSLKDLPTYPIDGLKVLAYPQRVDPRDAWLTRDGRAFSDLEPGDVVATGSLRRQSQILGKYPGVTVEEIRGNVDTRIRKLQEGTMAGIVLAMAGLTRLGLLEHVTEPLEADVLLPSPGQGALAIEGRDETRLEELLAPLEHAATRHAVVAERALLARLEGSCQVPIGAYAIVTDGALSLEGLLAMPDGSKLIQKVDEGPAADAAVIGDRLGRAILDDGGDAIVRHIQGPGAGS